MRRLSARMLMTAAVLMGTLTPAAADSWRADPLRTMPPVLRHVDGTVAAAGAAACEFDSAPPTPLRLSDAIQRALCHNPETRQAWAWVLQEAASVGIARGAYLPNISASASMARAEQRIDYSEQPGLSTDLSVRSTRMGMRLTWVLYDFGLRAADLARARHLLDAATAARSRDIRRILLETAQAYYALQSAQALLSAQQDARSLARHSLDVAQARYQEGVGSLSDRLLAQTQLSDAQLRVVQAEGEVRRVRGRLASVLAMPPATVFELEPIAENTRSRSEFSSAVEELIETAQQAHPEIRMAQAQLAAARSELDAVQAQGRPRISLVGTADRQDTPIERVSSRQVINSYAVGVQIEIPLFSGFINQYERRRAKAGVERFESELADARRRVALDVWEGYHALLTQTETLEISAALTDNARQSFEVAQGRYRAGVGSMLELLTAQNDLVQARQTHIAQLATWYDARLYLATQVVRLESNPAL